MRKLYLHIGSYKTGTTSIQNTLSNNRAELENQGFIYPGNDVNHHKFFFTTKSPRKYWPRYLKTINRDALNKVVAQYLAILEKDFKNNHLTPIISTEYLFIHNKTHIRNVINYLKKFFSEIVVLVFVRDPIRYYPSIQQQMLKARSYVTHPGKFRYRFRKVIESWKEFANVSVLEYSHHINSCRVLCNKMGIDYDNLASLNQRRNTSLSIEQMALLEKVQKHLYSGQEDVDKFHLQVISSLNISLQQKPELKESWKHLIYANHKNDLTWLKEQYEIDFLRPELDLESILQAPTDIGKEQASVREVYKIDEESVERYEALILDALLKNLVDKGKMESIA